MWRNTSKSIIASVKQQHAAYKLVNMFMKDAIRPANFSKSVVVEIDNDGSLAFATCVADNLSHAHGGKKNN